MIGREDLFQAIGELSEERLEQSEQAEVRQSKNRIIWVRYAGIAAAACLILVIGIAVPTIVNKGRGGFDSAMSESATGQGAGKDLLENAGAYTNEVAPAGDGYMDDAVPSADDAVYNGDDDYEESLESNYSTNQVPTGDNDTVYDRVGTDEELRFLIRSDGSDTQSQSAVTESSDVSAVYEAIPDAERKRMGYAEDKDLTDEDLGSYLGVTGYPESNEDVPEDIAGYKVYSTAKAPSDRTYVIVDLNGSYKLCYRIGE